jgi:hypothetical protein
MEWPGDCKLDVIDGGIGAGSSVDRCWTCICIAHALALEPRGLTARADAACGNQSSVSSMNQGTGETH